MDTKKLIGTIIGVTMFAVLIAGATFAWLTFGTTVSENVSVGQTMNFIVDYTKGNDVSYLPILDSRYAKPGVTTSNGVGRTESELGTNEASGVAIVMKKHTNSADGHAVISLTTTSDTALTKAGVVRWAICRDTNVEMSGQTVATTQIDDVCGGGAATAQTDFSAALNTGLVKEAGTIVLLDDAALAEGRNCTGTDTNSIGYKTQYNTTFYTETAAPFETIKATHTCPTLITDTDGTAGTSDTDNMISTAGVSYFVYFWLDGETITNEHLDDQYGDDGQTIEHNLYEGYVHASANQLQN